MGFGSGTMPTKRKRYMVNLPPEWLPLVEARAREQGRSIANYLEHLVRLDLREPAVEEAEQAIYHTKKEAPRKIERAKSA